MTTRSPEAALLEGRKTWCERGDCHVEFIGPLPNAQQYICDTSLAIWAVRLTALGPAWHRTGTMTQGGSA